MKREGVAVFGRKRREAEIEAMRAVLVDALARIDARVVQGLREQAKAQAATDATVQHLRSTVVETRKDLAQTVEQLADACAGLGKQVDTGQRAISERVDTGQRAITDRVDAGQRAIIETMTGLVRMSAVESPRSVERVLGGSFAASSSAIEVDVSIDVDAPQPPPERGWSTRDPQGRSVGSTPQTT